MHTNVMKAVALALGAVASLALSACRDYTTVEPEGATTTTTPSQDPTDGALQLQKVFERTQVLKDGRVVVCLTTEYAISCDWEHVPPAYSPAAPETPAAPESQEGAL